jgi:hypothetical protein
LEVCALRNSSLDILTDQIPLWTPTVRLDLTPTLARLAMGRIATIPEQKNLDPDIDEVYYWAYLAEYFSPWKDLATSGKEVDGTTLTLEGMMDELPIEEKEIVCVPESLQVPPHQIAALNVRK